MNLSILPFRATYYNQKLIDDLSKVICPPYDIINKRDYCNFTRKSKYNFCNILLTLNGDYKKIADRFRDWLDKKILIDDMEESIYLYEQRFNFGSKRFSRFGIICLLNMNKKGLVIPHEYTLKAPKEDRRRIIEEFKANLTPIFTVAFKPLKSLRRLYIKYINKKPIFSVKDYEDNLNRVWKIFEKEDIYRISKELNNQKILIADGHHRFEVAYEFFKENKGSFKNLNYILAYITDLQKGLLILPIHRIIFVESDNYFFKELERYFYIEKTSRKNLFLKLKDKGIPSFGLYKSSNFYFLRIKAKLDLDSIYKNLDSYLLDQILKDFFKEKDNIRYSHNLDEAINLASDRDAIFILKPVDISTILKIVEKSIRLPQKSTYFYPKILSGLVLRRFKI